MEDKELTCIDCGNGFIFTAKEQEEFANKGYRNEPKRCPECRRDRRSPSVRRSPREMHNVTCSKCGKDAQVPFKPRQDRPVYCDDCYRTLKT
jgi:CxxC-x17-CxxC domain-containing protein